MKVKLIDPNKIKVGKRLRSKVGDVADLKASMERCDDLIQPIVVTEGDNRLVCGERRLKTWKKMFNGQPIPCVIIKAASKDKLLLMEHDENAVRMNLGALDAVKATEKVVKALEKRARDEAITKSSEGNGEIADKRRRQSPFDSRKSDRLTPKELKAMPGKVKREEGAAKALGFKSRGHYTDAKRVAKDGSPKLKKAMDQKKIPIQRAAKLVRDGLTHKQQDAVIEAGGKLSIATTLRRSVDDIVARIRGIREDFDSVEEMFADPRWQGENIYDVIDAFHGATTLLVKFNKELRTYRKRNPEKRKR